MISDAERERKRRWRQANLERERRRMREYRAAHKRNGVCIECTTLAIPNHVYCEKHREMREFRREQAA